MLYSADIPSWKSNLNNRLVNLPLLSRIVRLLNYFFYRNLRITVNLINKDQLEILSSLRESVNEDKAELQADVEKLRNNIKELTEKNNMQLEQINSLLVEKVTLQSEGIGQRERLLERERTFKYVHGHSKLLQLLTFIWSNLKASINGKDIPEDIKARLLSLHEENLLLKEHLKTIQEKLNKAKAVRRAF